MRPLIIIASLALTACGISDGTELIDLSDEESVKLCEEYEPREVTCGEGDFEFTLSFASDCDTTQASDTPATCAATVGDFRDCFDALYALSDEEICTNEDFPAACDVLFDASCIQ